MSAVDRIPSYRTLTRQHHNLADSPISDQEIDENTSLEESHPVYHQPQVTQLYHHQSRKERLNKCGCQRSLIISTCLLVVLSLFLVREYQVQSIQLAHNSQLLAKMGVSFEFNESLNSTLLPHILKEFLRLKENYNLKVSQSEEIKILPIKFQPPQIEFSSAQPTIWVFNNELTNQPDTWNNLTHRLLISTASKTGHRVVVLTEHNWHIYLQPAKAKRLVRFFEKKLDAYSDDSSGLDIEVEEAEEMKRQIILLEILQLHGGIILKNGAIVTENFSWIERIHTEKQCNTPQKTRAAEVFGFHSQRYSPQPTKQDISAQQPTQRYMVRFPSLSPYFLKAGKNSEFLTDFLKTLCKLISQPSSFQKLLQDIRSEIPALKGQIQLRKLYYFCSQIVLREREDHSKGMALQYYNLATMNENFGPKKIQFILGMEHPDRLFTHLSQIPLDELELQFGEIRFFTYFDPIGPLSIKLQIGLSSHNILQDSYIHTYLLQRQSHTSLYAIETDPNPAINEKWEGIPKKIWSFLTGKLLNATLLTQLWVEHVHMRANYSGFQFVLLNQDNIDRFVSIERLEKIEKILKTGINIYEDTRMKLLSLALMIEQGGVWIDPLTILTQNVNWVLQGYKDFKIFNRFGQHPRVLLPFHPHRGGPFNWTHSLRSNGSKQTWHLGYDCSFMASQSQAELMINWWDSYLNNLALTYEELQIQFTKSGINDYLWIRPKNTQLLISDTLKHVLAVKQSQLYRGQIATETYGLRALNGFMGCLKMSDSFNFIHGIHTENSFLWRYPQKDVQNIIGPIFYPIKILNSTAHAANQLLISTSTWQDHIHNKSILAMNLLKTGHTIVNISGKMILEKNINVKEKVNWPKWIWLYLQNELIIKNSFSKRCLTKLRHLANQSGYQVKIVNSNNYMRWIDSSRAEYMKSYLEQFSKRKDTENSNLKDHYANIKERYILLNILYQQGGIIINPKVILLEDLTWLNEIQTHPFASQGEPTLPQVFGFFSPAYSSEKQLYDNHYLVKYPALEDFFIAAIRNSKFIGDVLITYMQILQDRNQIKKMLADRDFGQLRGNDPYYEAFFLSCQLVIHRKQEELDKFSVKLAVSHYGLVTLNTLLYPYKLTFYFEFTTPAITMRHFTDLPLAQLEKFTGPLRYLMIIPKAKQFTQIIEQIEPKDSNYTMVERCFIHSHFYIDEKKTNVVKQEQIEAGAEWNLPKKVWFYQTEASSTTLVQQILNNNTKFIATSSQFTPIGVNEKNIKDYIDETDLKKIDIILQDSVNAPHRDFLYRLAVLKQTGGVFIGDSLLMNQELQWLVNINKFDSGLLLNRIGSFPKTLLLYDTLSNDWTYNSTIKSLVTVSPIYSVDFIASQPKTELLAAWFEKMLQLAKLRGEELKKELSNCGDFKNWRSLTDSNLLGSDALTCILSQFQKNNPGKSSSAAFGVWSVSESLSVNKLDKHLKFLSGATLSPYLGQYSKKDSELIMGNLSPIIRITSIQINDLSSKLIERGHAPWGVPGSILHQLQTRLTVTTTASIPFQ